MQAGAEYNITPYGTEAMHVLRAEKGYVTFDLLQHLNCSYFIFMSDDRTKSMHLWTKIPNKHR